MFTAESALVKLWVSLVQNEAYPQYTADSIPALSNLREVVLSLL